MQKHIHMLSSRHHEENNETATKFNKLGRTCRTGHARFRRAPMLLPALEESSHDHNKKEKATVVVGDELREDQVIIMEDCCCGPTRVYCPRPLQQLPPLPPHHQKRRSCSSEDDGSALWHGRCHASKRRKLKAKRTVRVPAVSMKMADIPPDDFSWRKYGQKPIKGSPHPRGYYKCSTVRGCPARKHVERAVDDPTMMIITYEGDHEHILRPSANNIDVASEEDDQQSLHSTLMTS